MSIDILPGLIGISFLIASVFSMKSDVMSSIRSGMIFKQDKRCEPIK